MCACIMCMLSHSVVSDFCNSKEYSPPSSTVHGIFQARTLDRLPFPTQRDFPDSETKPTSPMSPGLAG